MLFEAVTALVARDDRTTERRVFQGFGGDRFRTAISRACIAAGVPTFSPHDLRHRRISLLHLAGVPWARVGEHVGQRNLAVTANTYSHVLADEAETRLPGAARRRLTKITPATSGGGRRHPHRVTRPAAWIVHLEARPSVHPKTAAQFLLCHAGGTKPPVIVEV
jgi:hypothetical protein